MKSLADGLPPEIAKHIDPDWRKNEAAYWALRDQLLAAYKDQWIAFVDGEVVASGKRPVMVYHAAMKWGSKAFVTCVGRENEPMRIRRTNFAYDMTYPGEALPVLTVEFRPVSGSPGLPMSQVIADTGADTSILPWVDCRRLNLDPAQGMPGIMGFVGGGTAIIDHCASGATLSAPCFQVSGVALAPRVFPRGANATPLTWKQGADSVAPLAQ